MSDPYGTAAIRERVLAGWAAAPVRLREDANAEEDLALGGYRDRLVVELAQNAADAAARAGFPGRLSLTLRDQPGAPPVLVAANTGEPLTAEGVQSLATLRASAKTDDGNSVGRFGVGFASVLAVTDDPAVLSRAGGVRFSRADTAAAVAERAATAPLLAAEVQRRDGHLPVLRLPFATEGTPPAGYDTVVVLPLRDDTCAEVVRRQLAGVDDALLLALPALQSVEVDLDGVVSEHHDPGARWHVARGSGRWDDAERAALLADRPSEERRQRGWQVLWALPRGDQPVPRVVYAPTPTDEPLSMPALLLVGFPLDPTRRHVAVGPLTDRLVTEAADVYAALLGERAAAGADIAPLVPTGLAAGRLDAALREAVLERLPHTALLRSVEHPDRLLRPRDAVRLDHGADVAAVLEVLAPMVAGLVAAPRGSGAALAALGVERLALADVIDAMPTAGEPELWQRRYAGLATVADDPNVREVLAALPVPLADGRVVRGARGVLLPEGEALPLTALETLSPFGLRVVHPAAAHPLLARLGATPATARAVLTEPAVRAALDEVADLDADLGADLEAGNPDVGIAGGPSDIADAVLSLVAAALRDNEPRPGEWADGELAWLSDLALPDVDGELLPAGALALPGSTAATLLDAREIGLLHPDVAARWSADVVGAVGVLGDLGLVHAHGVDLADLPDQLAGLADAGAWAAAVGPGTADDVVAVRDLDVVDDSCFPELLQHLASHPARRRALVDPVRIRGQDGARHELSYTAWWLRRRLGTTGLLDPTAGAVLPGLLDPAPSWLADVDAEVRRALGLIVTLTDLSGAPEGGSDPVNPELATVVLQRLSRPALVVDEPTLLQAWAVVASAADELEVEAPRQVRVLDARGTRLVDAEGAVVVDDPRWLQRPDLGGLVVCGAERAAALADLLGVPLASEVAEGRVGAGGVVAEVPGAVRALVPQAPQRWIEHDELTVDGHEVDWWVTGGEVHASTSDGLARGLAWAAGDWSARHAIAQLLTEPGDVVRLLTEDAAG